MEALKIDQFGIPSSTQRPYAVNLRTPISAE
jgi:hypothetical protein